MIRYLRHRTQSEQDELRRRTEGVLAKAVAVLQLAVVSQFGCGVDTTGGGGGDRGTCVRGGIVSFLLLMAAFLEIGKQLLNQNFKKTF